MKKFYAAAAAALLIVSALCVSGCGANGIERKASLTFGKKYIDYATLADEAEKQSYVTFNKDGTATVQFYFSFDEKTRHYTIDCKFIIVEDTVMCFYDSVTYFSDHNDGNVANTWHTTFTVSESVLRAEPSDKYFICEDFLDEIPNFGTPAT